MLKNITILLSPTIAYLRTNTGLTIFVMPFTHHLKPLGAGNEDLMTVNLDTGRDGVIVLGKNGTTFKAEAQQKYLVFISRQHLEIVVKDGLFSVKPVSRNKGSVRLNWGDCAHDRVTPLAIGDIITLLGKHSHYNYELVLGPAEDIIECFTRPEKRVRLDQHENRVEMSEESTAPIIAHPLEVPAPAQPSVPLLKISAEITEVSECSICLLPMAYAFNLSCGDSFCYSCIADWIEQKKTSCPNCNGSIVNGLDGMSHNRTLDNIIRELMKKVGDDAATDWESRWLEGKNKKKEIDDKKITVVQSSSSSSSSSAASGLDPSMRGVAGAQTGQPPAMGRPGPFGQMNMNVFQGHGGAQGGAGTGSGGGPSNSRRQTNSGLISAASSMRLSRPRPTTTPGPSSGRAGGAAVSVARPSSGGGEVVVLAPRVISVGGASRVRSGGGGAAARATNGGGGGVIDLTLL